MDLPEGEFGAARIEIRHKLHEICKNPYLLKNLEKLRNFTTVIGDDVEAAGPPEGVELERIENVRGECKDPMWSQKMVAESAEIFKYPFFCYSCCISVQTEDAVLKHLETKKHIGALNVNLVDQQNAVQEARRIQEVRQEIRHNNQDLVEENERLQSLLDSEIRQNRQLQSRISHLNNEIARRIRRQNEQNELA